MMGAPGATPPAPAITVAQQIEAVIREIGMRKHVYPGWVAKGKMKQEKADHELAAMEQVLVTLRDYQAMQPKVLALSAAGLTLAGKCGMKEKDFDDLLVELEKHAEIQLEAARKAAAEKPTVLLVDGAEPPAWPFRREPMP